MFNVVTIAREYGSGGADIGRKVADLLGWQCVDKQIIEKVAAMGRVDPSWAEKADEHTSTWWERVMKGFRYGGPEANFAEAGASITDHDRLQQFTASVIEEAAKVGRCVIIGRSSQCVLRHHPDAFRVLVYAPLAEKIARMKLRHPREKDLQGLLHRIDSERIRYARNYYGCDPFNIRLYHLCVNSTRGLDACAQLIGQTARLL